jgi:hypothetical protein
MGKAQTLFLLVLILPILFCLKGEPKPEDHLDGTVQIKNVPHVLQKADFCGEACVEMYLRKLGHQITQDDIFNISGLDPIHARGCYTVELARALSTIGFKTGDVWYQIPAESDQATYNQWLNLYADLLKGVPSIICMRTDNTESATEHFRLILGYDRGKREIIFHEPAETNGQYKQMELKDFLDCWPLKYNPKRWTIVRIRLEAAQIKPINRHKGFTNADFVQHMIGLKRKVPPKGFTIVIQKPFVVISDEAPDVVRYLAHNVVSWATQKLKHMYFKTDPRNIIDIWLFNGQGSYKKYAWEIFGDKPDTPFGYSSPSKNALIMNIRTGTGTLVHEMVHPFIRANFPQCPSWFNEGLASLYEQSTGQGNKIIGLTNWRLAGLQQAIRNNSVPSFKTLTATSEYEFYDEDPGTNYAQARYLCYYLQEKGLLTKFYHKFHANQKEDPTGYQTLKTILGEENMTSFKKKWERFILSLRQ